MSASSITDVPMALPELQCPAWCGSHRVDRDRHDPDGGAVVHNSRPHITLVSDGADELGDAVAVQVETAHGLFSGEQMRDFAIPDVPVFIVLKAGRDTVLTTQQAREVADGLITAADLADADAGVTSVTPAGGPDQSDVAALRGLLDLMADFPDNDQRARYLLSCNWMRDRGVKASARLRAAEMSR